MLLLRLSSNKWLKDDLSLFGRSQTWQSVIFNDVVTYLIAQYAAKVIWDSHQLTYKQLKTYANHIGFYSHTYIWGFIDGILKVICRPSRHNRGSIQDISSIMQSSLKQLSLRIGLFHILEVYVKVNLVIGWHESNQILRLNCGEHIKTTICLWGSYIFSWIWGNWTI